MAGSTTAQLTTKTVVVTTSLVNDDGSRWASGDKDEDGDGGFFRIRRGKKSTNKDDMSKKHGTTPVQLNFSALIKSGNPMAHSTLCTVRVTAAGYAPKKTLLKGVEWPLRSALVGGQRTRVRATLVPLLASQNEFDHAKQRHAKLRQQAREQRRQLSALSAPQTAAAAAAAAGTALVVGSAFEFAATAVSTAAGPFGGVSAFPALVAFGYGSLAFLAGLSSRLPLRAPGLQSKRTKWENLRPWCFAF
jgi:hypothetical protein